MNPEDRSIIGTYRGYFTYTGEKGVTHEFEFEINSLEGVNFHGVGTDGIGDFVVIGTYRMDRLTFKKIYRQRDKAEVNYIGDFSIDGKKVTGNWWLPDTDGAWEARLTYVRKPPSPETPVSAKEAAPSSPATGAPVATPSNPSQAPVSTNSISETANATNSEAGPCCPNCGATCGDFNFCTRCGHAFDLT